MFGGLTRSTHATLVPTTGVRRVGVTRQHGGTALPGRTPRHARVRGTQSRLTAARVPGRCGFVLMLVPVASASRDWGVLALLGPIEAHGGYILQRPNNIAMWGALLAAALERDALVAQLAELADRRVRVRWRPVICFHDLRHCMGTALAEAGVEQRLIQELLGHSGIRISERYTKPRRPALRRAALKATRLMGVEPTPPSFPHSNA
jgi:hypothetical protein